MSGRVVALLWLAPAVAFMAGLALSWLAGGNGPAPLALAVAAALLAGAPVAVLAALRGVVVRPVALAASLAAGLAGAIGFLEMGFGLGLATAVGLASGALAALFGVLPGTRGGWGLPLGAGLALAAAPLIGGSAGALHGLALGAAVAAMLRAAPMAAHEPRLRAAAPPLALGLLLALALLAGPLAALAMERPLAVPVLALLVALPGLSVVAAGEAMAPARLGAALLLLGALSVALALAVGTAPAAIGLIPAEAVWQFRLSVLGAAFLPALAALSPGAGPLLALALVSGFGFVVLAGTPWLGVEALAAPVLATALAAMLRRE